MAFLLALIVLSQRKGGSDADDPATAGDAKKVQSVQETAVLLGLRAIAVLPPVLLWPLIAFIVNLAIGPWIVDIESPRIMTVHGIYALGPSGLWQTVSAQDTLIVAIVHLV